MFKIDIDVTSIRSELLKAHWAALSPKEFKRAVLMGLRRTRSGVAGDVARVLRPHLRIKTGASSGRLRALKRRAHLAGNLRDSSADIDDLEARVYVGRKPEQAAHYDPRLRKKRIHGGQIVTVRVLGKRQKISGFAQLRGKNAEPTHPRAVIVSRTGGARGPLAGMGLLSASEIVIQSGQQGALLANAGVRFRREMDSALRFAVGVKAGQIHVRSRARSTRERA